MCIFFYIITSFYVKHCSFPYLIYCFMIILYIEINTCCVVAIKFYDVFVVRYFSVSLFVQGSRHIINAHNQCLDVK